MVKIPDIGCLEKKYCMLPPSTTPRLPAELEPARLQFIDRTFDDLLPSDSAARRRDCIEWIAGEVFQRQRSIPSVRAELSRQSHRPRVLAVTSGKGGVGKTTVSVNLAVACAGLGQRVLLFDADLGMANTHVFAGIDPARTLLDVVERRAQFDEIVVTGPAGVDLICGCSGFSRLASLSPSELQPLVRALLHFARSYDLLILDAGAGIGPAVTAFLPDATDVLVVATPNIAATLDAYGMIKVIHEMRLGAKVNLLVNQARSRREATEVFDRIAGCSQRFLETAPDSVGFLMRDSFIESANQRRIPIVQGDPTSTSARRFQALARHFLSQSNPPASRRL